MKNLMKIAVVMPVLLALLLAGCSLDDPSDPTGDVNGPTVDDAGARYVAIGNSLTAGFMDGGLIQAGQINSYPRLIANQLGLDNEEFTQPWIAAPGIGSSTPSAPTMAAGVLYFDGADISVLGETPLDNIQSILLDATQPTAYHNLGVPGALLADGLDAYDAASSVAGNNSFFEFINRSTDLFGNTTLSATLPDGAGGTITVPYESGSMTYKAIAKGGALATMWLGNNDVLGPATGGNPAPGFGLAAATAFQAKYTATLSILAGGLAQRNGFPATIVVANIPDITSIPYFIPLANFNVAIGGGWPAGFEEADVQFVRFPTLSVITTLNPLEDQIESKYTITSAEATDIATVVATFNQIIAGVATAVNASGEAKVGLMNANAILAGLPAAQGTHFSFLLGAGMDVETAAATTYFSLDGIHPNNVGYGLVANSFIDVINDLDGTSIPEVELTTLAWDPTYGVTSARGLIAESGLLSITPEAAAGMSAIFR